MSGRSLALAAALVAVAVWGSSCSTPPAPAAVASVRACFGATPSNWADRFAAHLTTLPSGMTFGLNAIADDTAFGQFDAPTGDGIGALDLSTGRLTEIERFGANVGGVGAMAVQSPWVVWEQLDSNTDLSAWSIHAVNTRTGHQQVVATSDSARGAQPLPVIANGTVAWAQPVTARGGYNQAEIRVRDLITGRERTLAAGRVSSPVYAGPYLIWAVINAAGGYGFQAVDAHTLRSVVLPATLHPSAPIGYLAGSPGYFAWSSQDNVTATVWRIGAAQTSTFIQDGQHPFQFLELVGHYLLWYTGTDSAVLDVTTGKGFDLPGTVAGSSNWIATAKPVDQPSGAVTSSVARIATPTAPAVTRCA
ncbi:MAG TPA: hypothetical protein VJ914_00565 [Pseudonocardiaceae bacterium]|nr:hypothetical protein [Pseudonocardiaceae bacterium]